MTSKHPQRCETCEHREIVHNHWMGTHRPRCKITKWFLDAYAPTTIEHDFIDKLGCASHSSASEPPEICCKCEDTPDVCGSDRIRCERAQAASEAREKMLDEIFGYISTKGVEKRPEGYYVVFGTFSLADMLEYLESLRQQGGKR